MVGAEVLSDTEELAPLVSAYSIVSKLARL